MLRNRDVPSATNQQLPSGALDAAQFAALIAPGRSTPRTLAAGFLSGALSEYHGGGLPDLTSTAIRYRNRASALAGLRSELALARSAAPTGATVSVTGEPASASGEVVTFTPATPSGPGGDELLVRSGPYVYGLTAIETPDRVSLAAEEALLGKAR